MSVLGGFREAWAFSHIPIFGRTKLKQEDKDSQQSQVVQALRNDCTVWAQGDKGQAVIHTAAKTLNVGALFLGSTWSFAGQPAFPPLSSSAAPVEGNLKGIGVEGTVGAICLELLSAPVSATMHGTTCPL